MGLVEAIKSLAKLDGTLVERVTSAQKIELNYTTRIKQKQEWITQLLIDDEVLAIEHESKALKERQAKMLLKLHAQQIKYCFGTIGVPEHAPIHGYYMKSTTSEKEYKELN